MVRGCFSAKLLMTKKILSILMLLAGGILIAYYWQEFLSLAMNTFKSLRQIKLRYALIAFSLYILSVYLFSERWKRVLDSLAYRIKSTALFPIIFGAIPINNLTPLNRMGGEPLRLIWVKRKFEVRYSDGFLSILFERLVEAIPIAMVAIYAMRSLIPFFKETSLSLRNFLVVLLLLLLLFALVYIFRVKLRSLINELRISSIRLQPAFIPTLLLSCAVWGQDMMRLKIITLSLGLHVPVHVIAAVSVSALVLGSVPFTPGGLGIVEGGLISALTFFGIPLSEASAIVLIERFISYALASIIGSFFLVYFGGLKAWKSGKSPS